MLKSDLVSASTLSKRFSLLRTEEDVLLSSSYQMEKGVESPPSTESPLSGLISYSEGEEPRGGFLKLKSEEEIVSREKPRKEPPEFEPFSESDVSLLYLDMPKGEERETLKRSKGPALGLEREYLALSTRYEISEEISRSETIESHYHLRSVRREPPKILTWRIPNIAIRISYLEHPLVKETQKGLKKILILNKPMKYSLILEQLEKKYDAITELDPIDFRELLEIRNFALKNRKIIPEETQPLLGKCNKFLKAHYRHKLPRLAERSVSYHEWVEYFSLKYMIKNIEKDKSFHELESEGHNLAKKIVDFSDKAARAFGII